MIDTEYICYLCYYAEFKDLIDNAVTRFTQYSIMLMSPI